MSHRCAKHRPDTGSSERKSPIQELLTSRDSPRFADAVISSMYAISSALGSISRQQEVLLEKIDLIAQKQEILQKEVIALRREGNPSLGMNSPPHSQNFTDLDIQAWLNSPLRIQEPGISPELHCSEMLNPSYNQYIDLTSPSSGSMENPGLGSPGQLINNSQKHI